MKILKNGESVMHIGHLDIYDESMDNIYNFYM
jgi:hypothetical protein